MKPSIILPLTALLSLTTGNHLSLEEYPSNVSPCVIQCLSEGAVVAGCVSYVDTQCTCVSPAFKDAVLMCLSDACTKNDMEAAGQLHEKACGTEPQ